MREKLLSPFHAPPKSHDELARQEYEQLKRELAVDGPWDMGVLKINP